MKSSALRVAITADPELPVPPRHYGGIERVIDILAKGLAARGHDVTVFAHPDSEVSCRLEQYRGRSSRSVIDTVRNATLIASRVWAGRFDVVHSFGRIGYLTPIAPHPVRKLMSYQRAITPSSITRARRLFGPSLEFTACSRHMIDATPLPGRWHVVYNAVPVDIFTFRERVEADAPLVFLGRLEEIKGPHLAIEAAVAAGRSLVLAGNIDVAHQRFFDERIRPLINDTTVRYIGPVDDRQKNALLGQAGALLMPIVWDEPFGIVMAEALACGTPVIGFNRASVPEVVDDGVTGFLADDVSGLVKSIDRIGELSRRSCRQAAEERFSATVLVEAYEELYQSQLAGHGGPVAPSTVMV